jgi:hypothetical protein
MLEELIKINNSNNSFLDSLDNNKRKKLISYALSFNNTKGIKANKSFRNDCSGFTRKVYSKFNIELFKLPTNELKSIEGKWLNGVELIWKYCMKHGKVFTRNTPEIGDIVFFDNTHDRNKNGKNDDYFTHVGIVVKVDSDKTVHYIHKATSGIKTSTLNLQFENQYKKNKKEVNSYLKKTGSKKLSSHLFRGYGSIFNKNKNTARDNATTSSKNPSKDANSLRLKEQSKVTTSSKSPSKDANSLRLKEQSKVTTSSKTPSKDANSLRLKEQSKEQRGRSTATTVTDVAVQHPPVVKDDGIASSKSPMKEVSIISKKYRTKIVKKATSYLGKKIKKEDFAKKVYASLGFNILDKEFKNEKYMERAIFWSIQKNGRLFSDLEPALGDLIFFDKISGKNLFLNIAIIERINKEQLTFIHSLNGVVTRGYLNRKLWKINKIDKSVINSSLVNNKNSNKKLSSQLFRRFGSLFSK